MTDNVITLLHPVDHDGVQVTSITLRRPKVRDIKVSEAARLKDGDLAAGIVMLSQVSGLPVSVIEDLDIADFQPASEVLEGFMTRQKGATGAPMPQTSPTS